MYLGDYEEDFATLNFKFPTRTTAGVPFNLASGVITIYQAGGTTKSTAGVVLSGSPFDTSVVGLNNVLINLGADAFYAIGFDYMAIITTGTVNGVSVVGETVAHFSIENRFVEVDVTAWDGNTVVTPTVNGVPEVDITHVEGATTLPELGVGVPSASPGIAEAIMLLYMALRNKLIVQTSGTDALEIHNDGDTLITKKLITDDGDDYTEAKMS